MTHSFTPEIGKVKLTANTNIRIGSPFYSKKYGVKVFRKAVSGEVLQYIGFVTDGEVFKGVTKWYLDSNGNFFWSGATKSVRKQKEGFGFQCNPLRDKRISQKFGTDPSTYKRWNLKGHHGLDFRTKSNGNPKGNCKVYAVLDGVVMEASQNDNNGKFVRLSHEGDSQSVYLHLDSVKVHTGDRVNAGNILGISGNTGFSSGPHLHFGYRPVNFNHSNGYMGYIDPEPFLF